MHSDRIDSTRPAVEQAGWSRVCGRIGEGSKWPWHRSGSTGRDSCRPYAVRPYAAFLHADRYHQVEGSPRLRRSPSVLRSPCRRSTPSGDSSVSSTTVEIIVEMRRDWKGRNGLKAKSVARALNSLEGTIVSFAVAPLSAEGPGAGRPPFFLESDRWSAEPSDSRDRLEPELPAADQGSGAWRQST
jgi:hypothetical protein